MALSNTTVKSRYTGDGTTVDFAIAFDYDAESEVRVILRDESDSSNPTETVQTQGVGNDYTLTGGTATSLPTTVTFATAPTSNDKVIVKRLKPYTQPTDYQNTSTFPAETHEDALDNLAQQIQDLDERIDRCITFEETSATTGVTMDDPTASYYFKWNTAGTAVEFVNVDPEANTGFETQGSNSVANNASATSTSMQANNSLHTSVIFEVEVDRSTSSTALFGNQRIVLQYKSSSWVLKEGMIFGDDHGLTWSVSESGGVATIQYASSNMAGSSYTGTLKFKRMIFDV